MSMARRAVIFIYIYASLEKFQQRKKKIFAILTIPCVTNITDCTPVPLDVEVDRLMV